METINFTIQGLGNPQTGYSIWLVGKKILNEAYFPNNRELVNKIIRSNYYPELIIKIRELNNLSNTSENKAQTIPAEKRIIKIPTLIEFENLFTPIIFNYNATSLIDIKPLLPANTIIFSPGHGMDRQDEDRGAVDPNGIFEINYVYRFTQFLYQEMDKLNLSYVNLKALMESSSIRHTVANKIDKSNEIFHSQGNVTLHFAIHADSYTRGYEGITLIYIDKPEAFRSRRIADFFSNKLKEKGFVTRLMKDSQTRHGQLGELRRTDAPAAYIEIGSLDSLSSITTLNRRLESSAKVLVEAINSFNIERPNR